MPHLERQLLWDGCFNTRHLGGLTTEDGCLTSSMALVRSDNLVKLTALGKEQLMADGVTTVIDLRFFGELEKNPNPFAESTVPRYLHRPMMSEHDQAALAPIREAQTTPEAYKTTLMGFPGNIAAILTAMANAEPGRMVIHCSAGKDRTGLTTALALRCAGVGKHDIAADYALTDAYLQTSYDEELAAISDPAERTKYAEDLKTKPEFILDTLNDLEARCGSVQAYLQAAGMEADTIERLRQRLLEPS